MVAQRLFLLGPVRCVAMSNYSVLILEDDPFDREAYRRSFGKVHNHNFDLTFVTDQDEALTFLETKKFHLIIVDYKLPGFTGVEFAKRYKELTPTNQVPIVMASGGRLDMITDRETSDMFLCLIAKEELDASVLEKILARLGL